MRLVAGVLALAWLTACVGEGDDRPARIAYLVPAIFRPSCATASCHTRTARAGGLVLDDDPETVRANLLAKMLIYPGVPAGSALLDFLYGDEPGILMPPDLPLAAADLRLIERWIEEGCR